MNVRRLALYTSAAWLLATLPAYAQTAPDAGQVVPTQALGFVQIKNLAELSGKIEAFAKRLGTPLPFSPLEKMQQDLGVEKGVDTKGALFVVLMPAQGEDAKPAPLVYVPVTDYADFLKGLSAKTDGDLSTVQLGNGNDMVVGRKGSYAVLAPPAFEQVLKAALKAETAGAGLAPARTWLADHDVAGVLTAPGIRFLSRKVQQGIAQVKQQELAEQFKPLAAYLDGLDACLKSCAGDVTLVLAGSRLDQAGNLEFGKYVLFAKNGKLAAAADGFKSAGNPLAGLPAVPYVMAMGGPFSEAMTQQMTKFGMEVLTAAAKDVPAEKLEKLEKLALKSAQVRSAAFLLGVGKDTEPAVRSMFAVMKVDDTASYMKDYVNYIGQADEFFKELKLANVAQSMKARELRINGQPAAEVTMEVRIDEAQKALLQKFWDFYLGPGGKIVATLAAVDRETIVLRYTPADQAKEFLDKYKGARSSLAQDKSVARTMALLPEGSQWVLLVSPRGSMSFANRALGAFQGEGGFRLPEFPAAEPVGMGVRLSSSGLEARLTIPAALTSEVAGWLQTMRHGKKVE